MQPYDVVMAEQSYTHSLTPLTHARTHTCHTHTHTHAETHMQKHVG